MRLTCPNCSADYEVSDGMIPVAGRHVQCSACHTRWFVHGQSRNAPSESQIVHRLESWRPRRVAVPHPEQEPAPLVEPRPKTGQGTAPEEKLPGPSATPLSAEHFVWEEGPVQPAPVPETGRPEPIIAYKPEPEPILAAPSRRPPLTLDVADTPPDLEIPERRGRFWLGLLLALLVVGLGFFAYFAEAEIAARVPALAGVLAAFTDWIDAMRESLARLTQSTAA